MATLSLRAIMGSLFTSCSARIAIRFPCAATEHQISLQMQQMRDEFDRATKEAALARANGKCEYCHLPFRGRPEYHHILECTFGGKNTLANCLVVCRAPCHKELTARGKRLIAKADRARRAANGIKRSTVKIRSAQKAIKKRRPSLPPRPLYEAIK